MRYKTYALMAMLAMAFALPAQAAPGDSNSRSTSPMSATQGDARVNPRCNEASYRTANAEECAEWTAPGNSANAASRTTTTTTT